MRIRGDKHTISARPAWLDRGPEGPGGGRQGAGETLQLRRGEHRVVSMLSVLQQLTEESRERERLKGKGELIFLSSRVFWFLVIFEGER
mmetsp:Transcript_2980/g.7755  ORF Transcript_2980/g.7755 Transcript_2980/m.7755 type:complete len:89 (+) Transcript_2980:540-806(+)